VSTPRNKVAPQGADLTGHDQAPNSDYSNQLDLAQQGAQALTPPQLAYYLREIARAVHAHASLLGRIIHRLGLLNDYRSEERSPSAQAWISRVWLTEELPPRQGQGLALGALSTEHDRTCWFDLNSSGQIVEETDG
jgi:hypothetical protein